MPAVTRHAPMCSGRHLTLTISVRPPSPISSFSDDLYDPRQTHSVAVSSKAPLIQPAPHPLPRAHGWRCCQTWAGGCRFRSQADTFFALKDASKVFYFLCLVMNKRQINHSLALLHAANTLDIPLHPYSVCVTISTNISYRAVLPSHIGNCCPKPSPNKVPCLQVAIESLWAEKSRSTWCFRRSAHVPAFRRRPSSIRLKQRLVTLIVSLLLIV